MANIAECNLGRRALPLAIVALFIWSFPRAHAQEVYPDCESPAATPQGRVFYVDPQRGSAANDGSAERPWRTLAEVFNPANKIFSTRLATRTKEGLSLQAINPDGPVKPGDTILLMSGDHGDVRIMGLRNEKFLTVAAARGQTPVIRQMTVDGASRWVFRGVKFMGERRAGDKARAIAAVGTGSWLGDNDNIVFVGGSFSTVDDATSWTPDDWISKPYDGGLISAARCLSVIGVRFHNLRNALVLTGARSLVADNLFEAFGNDAIEVATGEAVIARNRIRDPRHTVAEPLHADAIQGWTLPGVVNRNVVIERNWIENLNPDNDYMQGISIFEGEWDGIRIENNVVITNTWHGIALFGAKNGAIVNNTVIATRPNQFPTWIMVRETRNKRVPRNMLVRNNVAATIVVTAESASVDHNVVSEKIEVNTNERKWKRTIGEGSDENRVQRNLFQTFPGFSPADRRLDLRPGPNSPAAKAGSPQDAPMVDVFGRKREAPIDVGAVAR